eukprot:gene10752-13648_t
MTLDKFVSHMEGMVNSARELEKTAWPANRRVDFERFTVLMAPILSSCGID